MSGCLRRYTNSSTNGWYYYYSTTHWTYTVGGPGVTTTVCVSWNESRNPDVSPMGWRDDHVSQPVDEEDG